MAIDYRARVLKGATTLLDEKRPGWECEIDVDKLDVGVGACCVTARLSGEDDWYLGMEELDLTHGNGGSYVAHGFDAENPDASMYEGVECDAAIDAQQSVYATLNALWREMITERLQAGGTGERA
ncbi:hypothetical protein ACFZB5_35045 [Streptomyces nodosus]|uniref:hypothetical protein n=1 Tax=Streptomyces nodosus TaxID=40318 RepID=UPI0036EBC8FF